MSYPLSIARSVLAASAAALLFALPAAAQEPPTPPVMQQQQQQEFPPEVQAMLDELEETQEKLEELQDRALAGSESLQAEQVRIQGVVETALRIVEPEYESLVARFGELQQEAAVAQQAEDMEALQSVMNEAQGLQMRLQAAQAQAFEREEVDTAVTEYREQLVEEMARLDPEAPRLMERMEELVERLEEILG
jgi:predicted nuclease with TOPRIM domain